MVRQRMQHQRTSAAVDDGRSRAVRLGSDPTSLWRQGGFQGGRGGKWGHASAAISCQAAVAACDSGRSAGAPALQWTMGPAVCDLGSARTRTRKQGVGHASAASSCQAEIAAWKSGRSAGAPALQWTIGGPALCDLVRASSSHSLRREVAAAGMP